MLKHLCMTAALIGLMGTATPARAEEGTQYQQLNQQEQTDKFRGLHEQYEKIQKMTPEEKEAFFKDHPDVKEKMEKRRERFLSTLSDEERKEWNALPEGQKQEFWKKRKEKWQKMSREEKLELVNKKHDDMVKRREEKWKSLSDDDKLKFADERMNRKEHRWGGHEGHEGGGHHDGEEQQ